MIKQYRMWLLRQQRRRAQKRNEEVCASLSVRLIDGSLYIVNGGTLIHKFSTDNSVAEVIDQINEIRRMNLEINIEDAFGSLTSTEQMVFAKYVFENLSEFNRKILLSYIAANYPNSIQFIKEH